MKDSTYWMERVRVTAHALSQARALYEKGDMAESKWAFYEREYANAVKHYTDPMGMKP